MTIELCMGSSCSAKGAKWVLEEMKKALRENNLEDKVTLSGSLCLGLCSEPGANMKINGEVVTGVTRENFYEIFNEKIKGVLA